MNVSADQLPVYKTIVVVIIVTLQSPVVKKYFAKPQMFLNLFISNAGLLVIAMGQTIVMIAAGIDISVGYVTALVCMVLANQMENHGTNAYVLDGFLAGLGGFLFCLNSCSGFVEQAKGLEMDAISSAVIGGTMLSGGVGAPFGTLFGVLIKGTISSLITTQGTLSSWWVRITLSALLCFFIVLQSIFAHVKKKK